MRCGRAKLLGSSTVTEARGGDVVTDAVKKVKGSGVEPTKVYLVISPNTLKVAGGRAAQLGRLECRLRWELLCAMRDAPPKEEAFKEEFEERDGERKRQKSVVVVVCVWCVCVCVECVWGGGGGGGGRGSFAAVRSKPTHRDRRGRGVCVVLPNASKRVAVALCAGHPHRRGGGGCVRSPAAAPSQVIDAESEEVIQASPMTQVVYSGINPDDKKNFVYTTKNKIGMLHCHIFLVKDKAIEIPRTIGKQDAVCGPALALPAVGQQALGSLAANARGLPTLAAPYRQSLQDSGGCAPDNSSCAQGVQRRGERRGDWQRRQAF